MNTSDTDLGLTHRIEPHGNNAESSLARQLQAHLRDRRACCDAEAGVMTLLQRFREAGVPPLTHDLEQRLIDACLNCDSPLPNADSRPAILTV